MIQTTEQTNQTNQTNQYTQTLHIFAGQGVKHITQGYGMINRVPMDREKAKSVYVKFADGSEHFVSVAALVRAEMPFEELERIQLKYA